MCMDCSLLVKQLFNHCPVSNLSLGLYSSAPIFGVCYNNNNNNTQCAQENASRSINMICQLGPSTTAHVGQ